MSYPRVLFIEGCDFETFPAGGQLAMARSLIKIFRDDLALIGMTAHDPVGKWRRQEIGGTSYWFFPVCRKNISPCKPVIPARLTFYLGLQRYRRRILSLGCRFALIQAPEALLAVSGWGLDSLCFLFPGVENPLRISRYRFARALWPVFDRWLFSALDPVSLILASADEAAIGGLVARSHGRLPRERVVQLPTCVDLSEFRPSSMREARTSLGLPQDHKVFVTIGRIGQFKGWELLLDAFALFQQKTPHALLIFVGDGEDRPLLESSIAARGLGAAVGITGFQTPDAVARHLNAADAVVSGSFVEGWSVAMLEALACGRPLVSTNVSGVSDMVIPGRNGFVVRTRDPREFAAAMEGVLSLTDVAAVSTAIADRFSLTRLGERLSRLWPALRPRLTDFAPGRSAGQFFAS